MDMKEKLRQLIFGTKRVKVPTILQMEAVECGAASLAMGLAYRYTSPHNFHAKIQIL